MFNKTKYTRHKVTALLEYTSVGLLYRYKGNPVPAAAVAVAAAVETVDADVVADAAVAAAAVAAAAAVLLDMFVFHMFSKIMWPRIHPFDISCTETSSQFLHVYANSSYTFLAKIQQEKRVVIVRATYLGLIFLQGEFDLV